METIKQSVATFFDKAWLKVNAILSLEEMEILGSFQLVLNNILADPLLLVLAIGIIASIPYIVHKIKTVQTEKEKRLDALLQELEQLEENEETHKGNSLLKNQPKGEKTNHPNESLGTLNNEAYGNEFESSGSEKTNESLEELNLITQENINDDLSWDSSSDKWSDLYDHLSQNLDEDKQVPIQQSIKMGGDISEDTLTQKPLEIMDHELSWESNHDEWTELYDTVAEKPLETDMPAKNSIEKDNLTPEIAATELTTDQEEQDELDKFADSLEAISKIEKESIEAVPEEEKLEEVSDFLEAVSELEKEPMDITTPTPAFNIPERIELSLKEIEVEELIKPKSIEQAETTSTIHSKLIKEKSLTAGPLLNSMLNSSVSAKTDALVSRLKIFQEELETRFQSLETESKTTQQITKTTSDKKNNYQPASVNYKSIKKSRSNKEYLSQLESFIFMAKQKNINSD
jgi:hypothetical protein